MNDLFVLESFRQRGANCVAVALIKTAIIRYGVKKIFKIKKRNDYEEITMQDDKMLLLTRKEIQDINAGNQIWFRRYRDPAHQKLIQKTKVVVETCFAVMVRNIQLYKYEGKEYTQSEARRLLVKEGLLTDHMPSLLGLHRKGNKSGEVAPHNLNKLKRRKAVLLFSKSHIVAASNGYFDDYGKAKAFGNTVPVLRGRKANHWFQLK